MMTVNVVFSGLTTPNTAAHIHCCVASPGTTGVATTVPTFMGFPTGTTSGTYSHPARCEHERSGTARGRGRLGLTRCKG
jgi:hypothetical protein